jgi:hypothetical protein
VLDSARSFRELGFFRSVFDRSRFRPDRAVRDLGRPRRLHVPHLGLVSRLTRWRSSGGVAVRNMLIVIGIVVVMVGVDALGRSAGM